MFRKIKSFLFRNTTAKQTVAKNTVWLSISNFGGRLVKAVIVIYGARVLGAAGWGVFSYAVTLAGFFTLFMDPGVNAVVMRDVPKAGEEERLSIFSTALVLKVAFIILAAAIILTVGPVFSTLPGAKELLPIVVLIVAFDTVREFFSSFMRALEKMEWEAGVFLLTNVVIVAAGLILLARTPTPGAFALAYAIGTACGAIVAGIVVHDRLKNLFAHFAADRVLPIIKSAWPFAITGALGILLTNTDILIISWMRSAAEVGVYSAAIRIVQILYLIPVIIQYTTIPLLSRLANRDDAALKRALERVLGIIFLVSIPVALGGVVLGSQIMPFVFGAAYASGGIAFSLLMITLIVDYPQAVVSGAIFAYDRQKTLIVASLIGGIGNVIFDLLFIPHFGIAGSSVATVLAQAASNWYLWRTIKKINNIEVVSRLPKIIAAAAIMTVAAYFLSPVVPLVINIPICIGLYFLLLIAFREPLLREIRSAIDQAEPSGAA